VAKRLARHFAFGRSRVLTPVPPDQVWIFFRVFPTPSQIRRMLGQYQPLSTYHLPSALILTVPIPNIPVRLWKASAARPPSGGMKDVSFPVIWTVNCNSPKNYKLQIKNNHHVSHVCFRETSSYDLFFIMPTEAL
jgi:hypothetical protein